MVTSETPESEPAAPSTEGLAGEFEPAVAAAPKAATPHQAHDRGPKRVNVSTRLFAKTFHEALAPGSLQPWVLKRIALAAVAAALVALPLSCWPMVSSPRVFVEVWAEGVVLSPAARVDVVQWVRPRIGLGEDAQPFNGIDLGGQDLATAYRELAGTDPIPAELPGVAGGVLRSFMVDGNCQMRVGRTPGNRLEFRVQAVVGSDADCVVSGELEPISAESDPEWGPRPMDVLQFGPRVLGSADRALLRFAPPPSLLPVRVGRFEIRGVGFGSDDRNATASLIHGGVLRLPDFPRDGEAQVHVLGRTVGRGHPIHSGDWLDFGGLRDAVILQFEIDDLIHAQLIGTAPAPRLAGRSVKPTLLQQLNDQNALVWVIALVLGSIAMTAAVIEAARP